MSYQNSSKRPIKVKDLKSARRLLSRLIIELQADSIESRKAKDLTYLVNSYVQIFKDSQLEARISELEAKIESH